MAAFSALTHANNPDADAILDAMGQALKGMAGEAADYFYQFLDVTLGETPAGDKWRNIMGFVNYFPGRGHVMEKAYLEGKDEGKAAGEAMGILRVLEVRGLPVSDAVRERITSCTDLARLDDWLDRAGTVTDAEELFSDDAGLAQPASEQA